MKLKTIRRLFRKNVAVGQIKDSFGDSVKGVKLKLGWLLSKLFKQPW